MLAVIDYGAGNLRSVVHALTHLGVGNMRIVRAAHELRGATRIILPGVGAFGAGMAQLRALHLVEPIVAAARAGVPYLGICLGMQFLFDSSDEMGDHTGFGLLPGRVTRFADLPGRKVPHMGWNQLCPIKQSALLDGLGDGAIAGVSAGVSAGATAGATAYFVHSYHCVPSNVDDVLIRADYGELFCAGVAHNNLYGVQFHPEKSQRTGLRLLRNFLAIPSPIGDEA